MLNAHQVEELICIVSSMDRPGLTHHLLQFRGSFPVDFTVEFLDNLSLERIRHIYVALCMQNHHLPATQLTNAA